LNNLRPGKSSSIRVAQKQRNRELSEALLKHQIHPIISSSGDPSEMHLSHGPSLAIDSTNSPTGPSSNLLQSTAPSMFNDQWRNTPMYPYPAYYAYPHPLPVKSEDPNASPPLNYAIPHPAYYAYPTGYAPVYVRFYLSDLWIHLKWIAALVTFSSASSTSTSTQCAFPISSSY
jgi:hypothetical protein